MDYRIGSAMMEGLTFFHRLIETLIVAFEEHEAPEISFFLIYARSALSALEGYHGVLWLHSRTEIICSETNYEISKINVRCKEININHII